MELKEAAAEFERIEKRLESVMPDVFKRQNSVVSHYKPVSDVFILSVINWSGENKNGCNGG